jgi:hypothetical protein
MDFLQVVSLVGALGIGSVIGVLVKIISDRELSDKKMLFEARIKAYSGITGRVFNLFLEPDITVLKENALIWAKLNQLLSGAMLMSSHNLSELLGEYKVKVFEFHCALTDKRDDESLKKINKDLIQLAGKIHIQMRKDLYVDNKSVFNGLKI